MSLFKNKLRASILWLMSKSFNNNIPLELLDPFDEFSGNEDFRFKESIIIDLANAELYALCLENIYSDARYSGFTHSDVVELLIEKKIFRENSNMRCFSENILSQIEPFALEPHIAIVEGLINLYIFDVLDPNQVSLVCDGFIPVHDNELPEDAEEAALFWINKCCLRKRQEIILSTQQNGFADSSLSYYQNSTLSRLDYNEHHPVLALPDPLIHDITDLSDGCALALLLSLYCPNDFNWQDIRFDPIDPAFNINRILHFCHKLLPYNICFLTAEDLLSIIPSMSTNILAFIADLLREFVVQPCDLVIVPCRIVQHDVHEELIENLKISETFQSTRNPVDTRDSIQNLHQDVNQNESKEQYNGLENKSFKNKDSPQQVKNTDLSNQGTIKSQAFLIEENLVTTDSKKKVTLMQLSLKRKAELEAKRAQKDSELQKLKEKEDQKKEQLELRRQENKKRREQILEQYRQKKKEAEAEDRPNATIPISINDLNSKTKSVQQQQLLPTNRNEYTGPKLFAKPTIKTNLNIIQKAILKALEGAPNAKTLNRMQAKISACASSCRHFLILFRDRLQFRGLYDYNERTGHIVKLDGTGPKSVSNEDIIKYYKFDLPKRQFAEVQTKHICLTIIAFAIHDSLWMKSISTKSSSTIAAQNKNIAKA